MSSASRRTCSSAPPLRVLQAPKLDFLKKFGLDLDKFVDLGLLFLSVTASLIVHHGLDKQHVEARPT